MLIILSLPYRAINSQTVAEPANMPSPIPEGTMKIIRIRVIMHIIIASHQLHNKFRHRPVAAAILSNPKIMPMTPIIIKLSCKNGIVKI